MNSYRTIAIPTRVAEIVRATMRAPGYGHPAQAELATGYGPCRHCLRFFRVGEEERILFTYDPFYRVAPYPLPGPVFVHSHACKRYPEGAGFPLDLASHRLTFAAYSSPRRLLAEEYLIEQGKALPMLQKLIAIPDVDYLHIRDTEAGCFDFQVEPLPQRLPAS